MRNLELDLLRTFAAVAETGSFTAAAERVSRTQSAVSMQIKRLEETLGRRVFERTSRSLALTGEGRILVDYAQRMLSLNDESLQRLARPFVAGHVRLGVTEYFVPAQLPRLLSRFAAAHPGVQLDVRMGLSRDLRADLHGGRLDAAIVRLDGTHRGDPAPIWREPQVWAAGGEWEEDRAAPLPLAVLPPGCVLREFALETLRGQSRASRIAYVGSSMASVQAAVVAGLGVSILARSSVTEGMRILPAGRRWPNPGELAIGVLRGKVAHAQVVAALETVLRQVLGLQ